MKGTMQLMMAGILTLGLASAAMCAEAGTKDKKAANTTGQKKEKGMSAVIETSMGKIVVKLFPDKAPETVANFTGLAEGTKEWMDPATGQKVKKRFYDGLIFHRVIPNFMVQGGCPLGNGTGGPGYQFKDEIAEGLTFDRPGLLAMANSGPGTNGSQFFITTVPTPWLTGRHTIFGEVTEGMDVVTSIGNAQRGPADRPVTPIVLKKVTIVKGK